MALSDDVRRALQVRLERVTCADVARATGISHAQLSRFVRGQRRLSEKTLNRLAEYLGLTVTRKID